MPPMTMTHDVDPKEELLSKIGDLSEFEVFLNDVVVALYVRPEKTKGGIILTDKYRDEDRFQGKVGLVVALGRRAFVDETGEFFSGGEVKLHDWVWFRPSDGFALQVNETDCRSLKDTSIRGKIPNPDFIW